MLTKKLKPRSAGLSIPPEVKAEIEAYDKMFQEYSPKNQKEEKELLLAKIIAQREQKVMGYLSEIDELKSQLLEFELGKEVHKKVMSDNPSKKEDWKYNVMDDFVVWERNRLAELGDYIKYDSAWLETARKMIKTKKYQGILSEVLDHFHFDGDGHSFWEDEIGGYPSSCEMSELCDEEDIEDIPF